MQKRAAPATPAHRRRPRRHRDWEVPTWRQCKRRAGLEVRGWHGMNFLGTVRRMSSGNASAKFNLGTAVIYRVASFLYSRYRKAQSHPRVVAPTCDPTRQVGAEVPCSASQFGSFPRTQPINTSIVRNVVSDGFHSAGLGG